MSEYGVTVINAGGCEGMDAFLQARDTENWSEFGEKAELNET